MSVDDLIRDIGIGHEIEFVYEGIKYSICPDGENCSLYVFGDESKAQTFSNIKELIKNLVIAGKRFEDIFKNVQDLYIY